MLKALLILFLLALSRQATEEPKINLENLNTEKRNPKTMHLDKMSSLEIVQAMNEEDMQVPQIISKILPQISEVVDIVADAVRSGYRIFYLGAGTSGRLAVADAAECPPTFSVSPTLFNGLMAGGSGAFLKAVEGAEDNPDLAIEDLKQNHLTPFDIVIGVAASGRTPYVIGGVKYAKELGCITVSITCSQNSELSKHADFPIEAVVGPEVLTGSTRLKAGTAQKLILNMISTGAMILNGKVYENLMVDVMMTNEKLKVRGENILMDATKCDRQTAKQAIEKCSGSLKAAIVMIEVKCDVAVALSALEHNNGDVRSAIDYLKRK